MHAAANPSPWPSVRAAHQSKAPSPFTPPAFIKHVSNAASAELILSPATNGLCVLAIANGGTAAERARRWVFPFPGASTGEQQLWLLSLVGGGFQLWLWGALGWETALLGLSRVGGRARTLFPLPAGTAGVNESRGRAGGASRCLSPSTDPSHCLQPGKGNVGRERAEETQLHRARASHMRVAELW